MKKDICKDNLEQYYLTENHTHSDTCKHFNISSYNLYQLLHTYNLEKPTIKQLICKIDKDLLYDLYINQNKKFSEILNYFKLTPDLLRGLLTYYNISKNKIYQDHINDLKNYAATISRNVLYQYYVVEKHSQAETEAYFNIRHSDLIALLKQYNIRVLTKSTEHAAKSKSDVEKLLSKELLEDLYITQNKSIKEIAKLYKVSVTNINYLIASYNLKKSKELQTKLSAATKLNKYGCLGSFDKYSQYTDEFKTLLHDKQKSESFLANNPDRYTAKELADQFNCNTVSIYYWANKFELKHLIKNINSYIEQDLSDIIYTLRPDLTIIKNSRTILPSGKELDIYIPELKLAIEYNGTYWHSLEVLGDKKYHLQKSIDCSNLGIRLLHIYEYEWLDPTIRPKVEQLLRIALNKVETRIYARNCNIKVISNKEATILNSAVHLQGHRNAQITLGLFHDNELVQLMSFSKSRYNKNLKTSNSWEIIRGCPGSNNIVVGGVSKLFNHFIKTYDPDFIFSYCDFNKFNGKSYEKLGMKFVGYTGPDKKYIINGKVLNRNPHNYKQLKALATGEIWGAGSKKYLWKKINCIK